jgi:aryl-alcohol dehydrogenase-like predicted oxidoreductase
MRYGQLGHSGLRISQIILGAAAFGESVGLEDAARIVDEAIDLGVCAIDTADVYGNGRSEELLGQVVGKRRPRVVLATKVGRRVGDSPEEMAAMGRNPSAVDHAARWRRGISPNDHGLSRAHVSAAVEASLRRLGTDYIDLYQIHHWDPCTPIEETLDALDRLVQSGKVRYIGCSGVAAWQLYRSLWISEVRSWARFESVQVAYNLLRREAEHELFPACAAAGVGVLAFQLLAGGFLSGRYAPTDAPAEDSRLGARPMVKEVYWTAPSFHVTAGMAHLAARYGRSVPETAVGWVLARPEVHAAIVGVSRPCQLAAAIAAAERPLEAPELRDVGELLTGGQIP